MFLRICAWLIKPGLLLAIMAYGLFFVISAHADLVASRGGNELRLLNEPCTHEGIRARLTDEYRDQFKRAVATFGKVTMQACWIDTMSGAYFVVFSDGDALAYPVSGFISQPGI